MAGIYIHIPFCKQACHYCNFHFSTNLQLKEAFIEALIKEMVLRKDYLQGQQVETVYFGGGTPSMLEAVEIRRIWEHLNQQFTITDGAEITLEANPDDLTAAKVQELRQTPVTRFSIGIQSFHEADLLYMNRAHNAAEAEACVKLAQDAGFDNITIDLIYGGPTLSDEGWQQNMIRTFALGIPHFSAYCLTVEPKTALADMVKKKKVADVDDAKAARHFSMLMEAVPAAGYEHYEISNFALPGRYSKHNSNYWKGAHYLGLGPSAHSFNGTSRSWNVANNAKYIKALTDNQLPLETEQLSLADQYNEYLMTSLRTMWGADMGYIEKNFGLEKRTQLLGEIGGFNGKLLLNLDKLTLANEGKLMADSIISELFDVN
jgi:oxygen-independent coproporphyrinogen-3 oxidase